MPALGPVAALAAHGVRTELIDRTSDMPTGSATILVTPEGENSIIVVPGANSRIGETLIGESEISRITRSLAFASGHLRVGDRKVATATAVFHIPPDISAARKSSSQPAQS